jgi:Protein of unknown function (DUF3489)
MSGVAPAGKRGRTRRSDWKRTCMPTFTIDTENNVTVFASLKQIEGNGEGTEIFSSTEELAALAEKWPGARLAEIWNSLPGVQPVERFTSRQVAVTRIWKAIQQLQHGGAAHRRKVPDKQGNAKNKAGRKARTAARENSKTARVMALLRQPTGASLKTIMRVTGWQAHSVRGFISGQLGKKMGLRVRSVQRDGERFYALKA